MRYRGVQLTFICFQVIFPPFTTTQNAANIQISKSLTFKRCKTHYLL